MKCLKVLGFAAVAAVALTAFIGASSASATVLCKTTPAEPNTNSCPSGWDYPSETTFTLTVDQTIHWIAGPIDDTCTSSTVKGKTSTTGGATSTVNGNIETLTFTGCTCPVTVLKPGSLEIHWISGTHNGTLTGKGSEWTVNCSGISCSYGTSATGTDLGKVTSSATSISSATLDIGDPATGKGATLPKLGGSFLCPSTEEWTGSYWITEPVPLYVAETG
jgi:hypothetical protein